MSKAEIIWGVMGLAVIAYALTGGADYGGGVWHLFSRRHTDTAPQRAIERAIAPIWEANHVWLIFVIVLLFTAFPDAFSAISIALHIPITLALVGIVLRGSAFVFHAYGLRERSEKSPWAPLFGLSSLVTPLFLGNVLASVATGAIGYDGTRVTTGFFAGWMTPFAWLSGLFTLALFALLAAVYLTVDTSGPLREYFRRRALAAEVVAGVLAFIVLWSAGFDAPSLQADLLRSPWALTVQALTAFAAVATIAALWSRRFKLARVTVATQVALVVLGYGLSMDGALVLGSLTVENSGAHDVVLSAMLPALAVGGLLLAPSLYSLFRVFKSG